jgi:hypothetical protein
VTRFFGRAIFGLIVAIVVLYVSDWAVWRLRVARDGGMGSVTVTNIVVMPLKNNKEEYDWGGSSTVSCSRSLFPQVSNGACWWLQRHPVVYQR